MCQKYEAVITYVPVHDIKQCFVLKPKMRIKERRDRAYPSLMFVCKARNLPWKMLHADKMDVTTQDISCCVLLHLLVFSSKRKTGFLSIGMSKANKHRVFLLCVTHRHITQVDSPSFSKQGNQLMFVQKSSIVNIRSIANPPI